MTLMELGYHAHPEGDKCFKVSHDDRGWSVFVWARFNAEARRHGASALDSDWESVVCERFPRLDHFEGDLVTWCLKDGWRFECAECEKTIGDPEHGYDPYYRDRDALFCSKEHADKYYAHWDGVRALEKRFAEYAGKKYPEATVRTVHLNVEGDGIVYFAGDGCRIILRSELDPEI
jgi:hypothetical protein